MMKTLCEVLMLEVEVKIPVRDLNQVEKQLQEMDFRMTETHREEDIYFDNEAGQIRKNDCALRIRRITGSDGNVIANVNFKGAKTDTVSMTREELETDVQDPEVMQKILHALGYRERGCRVCKQRTMYVKDDLHMCLDEVSGLGTFLEIEIIAPEEAYDAAMSRIEEMMKVLGLSRKDTVRKSYLSMLMQKQ